MAQSIVTELEGQLLSAQSIVTELNVQLLESLIPKSQSLKDKLLSAQSKVTELEGQLLSARSSKVTEDLLLSAQSSKITKLEGQLLSAQSKVTELEHGIDVWSTQAKKLEARIATELEPARLELASILASFSAQSSKVTERSASFGSVVQNHKA